MNEPIGAEPASDLTYFAFASTAAMPGTPTSSATHTNELPQVLGGRYRIERLLGVGGMGAVYRARDLLREQFGDPEPYIALKTLNDEFAEYPDAHALLYTEFALTARLSHRHVVRLFGFDVDTASQRAFITLELLKGPTLDQLLSERPGGLAWDELREIALPLIEALAYSHIPPNLTLYSLYMHLLDWPGYQAQPDLPRPAFWETRSYTVNTQNQGLSVRAGPSKNAAKLSELSRGAEVAIGETQGEFSKLVSLIVTSCVNQNRKRHIASAL